MIEDENDPLMRLSEAALAVRLQVFNGASLSSETFHQLNELLIDHRTRCRQQGVNFPVLAALVVPRLSVISLVNAELEGDALRIRIVGFARQNPKATAREVAQAVKWAFPDYRGGTLAQ